MRIRGALAWLAVLGASALACAATPDLVYANAGLGEAGVDPLASADGGDASTGSVDGEADDGSVPDDAAVKDDAYVPTDASQPVTTDGGTTCTPNLGTGQGCCPVTGVPCIGAGCSYCLDCVLCGSGYCCRVGKGNNGHPFSGQCKATVSCK